MKAPQSRKNYKSYAKINLCLNVIKKITEGSHVGYHDMYSVFAPIALHDTIEFEETESGGVQIFTSGQFADKVPSQFNGDPHSNIVCKAFKAIEEKFGVQCNFKVNIVKNIPVAAGLGGGSSNAACAIKFANNHYSIGLSDVEMCNIAAKIGADVPFFIHSRPAICTGIGDKMDFENLDLINSQQYVLLINLGQDVSTPAVFKGLQLNDDDAEFKLTHAQKESGLSWDDIFAIGNSLLAPAAKIDKNIEWLTQYMKEKLPSFDVLCSGMSGSGGTCFAVFNSKSQCELAEKSMKDALLKGGFKDAFVCVTNFAEHDKYIEKIDQTPRA